MVVGVGNPSCRRLLLRRVQRGLNLDLTVFGVLCKGSFKGSGLGLLGLRLGGGGVGVKGCRV